MKKATKTLLLMLCAVVLVVSSVLGTVAYLTDTKSVENTFTVGNVTITLEENAMDVATGELKAGEARVTKMQDIKFVPGRAIKKQPVITVGDKSENCWLFVKVENGSAIDILGNGDFTTSTGWKAVDNNSGWYRYDTIATKDSGSIQVFDCFTCHNLDSSKTADLAGGSIMVTAYAIQAEGDAVDTWEEAFDVINPPPTNP